MVAILFKCHIFYILQDTMILFIFIRHIGIERLLKIRI